jgi:hypothetical protein
MEPRWVTDLYGHKKSEIPGKVTVYHSATWHYGVFPILQYCNMGCNMVSSPNCIDAEWGEAKMSSTANGDHFATKWGFAPILHFPKVQENHRVNSKKYPQFASPHFVCSMGKIPHSEYLLTHFANKMGKQISGQPGFPKQHVSTKLGTCAQSFSNALFPFCFSIQGFLSPNVRKAS